MTEQEIFEAIKPFIVEVTGVASAEIRSESILMQDLGAESLDLLDLCFLIEERFGIRIESNEFERRATAAMDGEPYETDGLLTPRAVEELRRALPEVDGRRLVAGMRKMLIPSLLTVSVFVHLIERKLAEKAEGAVHA